MTIPFVFRRLIDRRRRESPPAEQEATSDVLTGLANRRHFLRVTDEAIGDACRRSQYSAVLLINLDDFRQVNDRYGHAAGDAVLVAVAQRLSLALPSHHVSARLGGDEFAILLGEEADLQIEYCAEQVAARIRQPISFAGRPIQVTASIGIAMAPDDGMGAAALIAAADERMSFCKRKARPLTAAVA